MVLIFTARPVLEIELSSSKLVLFIFIEPTTVMSLSSTSAVSLTLNIFRSCRAILLPTELKVSSFVNSERSCVPLMLADPKFTAASTSVLPSVKSVCRSIELSFEKSNSVL